MLRPIVPRMPRIEVYERTLSGTNESGIKMRNEASFHIVADTWGNKACKESANRTTKATLRQHCNIYKVPCRGKFKRE